MQWGCFAAPGTDRLVRIKGKMNAATDRDILDENMFLTSNWGNGSFISRTTTKAHEQDLKSWLQNHSVNVAKPESRLESYWTSLERFENGCTNISHPT